MDQVILSFFSDPEQQDKRAKDKRTTDKPRAMCPGMIPLGQGDQVPTVPSDTATAAMPAVRAGSAAAAQAHVSGGRGRAAL